MKPIKIKREQLHALARLAGKKDARKYLNGVCIETGPEGTFAIATDGHRLGAFRLDTEARTDEIKTFILPVEDVAWVPKKGGGNVSLTIHVNHEQPEYKQAVLADEANNITLHTRSIDGNFPDWRRVLPAKCNGQAGHFSIHYLKDFDMVAKDLGVKLPVRVQVLHNGPDNAAAVLIMNHPEFLGVLMPVKGKNLATCDWWTVAQT